MRAKDKLRVYWDKREDCLSYFYPLGCMTKCDAGFLSGYITDKLAKELEERGYDPTTLKFSIEPKKGDERFASQREED